MRHVADVRAEITARRFGNRSCEMKRYEVDDQVKRDTHQHRVRPQRVERVIASALLIGSLGRWRAAHIGLPANS